MPNLLYNLQILQGLILYAQLITISVVVGATTSEHLSIQTNRQTYKIFYSFNLRLLTRGGESDTTLTLKAYINLITLHLVGQENHYN